MEVHNVPEASYTNTFAEKGKSETFTYLSIKNIKSVSLVEIPSQNLPKSFDTINLKSRDTPFKIKSQ